MGRTKPFLTPDVLSNFDVYTISFGDNWRYYMRGQLTVFKNVENINNIWRKCRDLRHIGRRLKSFYGHNDSSRRMDGWRFESAEGCISHAIAHEKSIKAISVSNLLTDAFSANYSEKHSLIVSGTVLRCYEHPLVSTFLSTDLSMALSDTEWYALTTDTTQLIMYVSFRSYEIPKDYGSGRQYKLLPTSERCSPWVPMEYQVLLTYM